MALTLLHEISPLTLPRPVKAVKNGLNHVINSTLERLHSGLRVAPLALAVLVAFGFSQTSTFAVVLSNGQLSIDIRTDNGAIDTALLNGNDFFNAGTPVSDWGMQNGTDTASFVFNDTTGVTQQPVTVTSTATTVTVTGTYTAGGSNVAFSRVYRLVAGVNALTVVTALTNNAASTINLRYFDTFDPDQGAPLGLGSATVNDVLVQGGIPVARSSATNDLTFTIGSIFGESSILASGNPFRIDSGSLLNGVVTAPFDGNGATADNGQHLVYVRSIAPGQTVVTHGVLAFGATNVAAINDFVIAASTTGPGVSTDAATSVTTTSATLNGSANPYNQTTTAFFVYGTDPTLLTGTTRTSTQSLGNGSGVVPFSEVLTGLTPGTTYYYRASGTNVNGTNTGSIASFSTGPEIAVEQPVGTDLVDGSASVSLPDALVATTTPEKTFTIRNVGNLDLTGLSISKDGADSDDFTVSAPVSTTVVGGGSTTFTVSFTPGALGARTAAIHIASNDVDENPFDINLTGNGVATLPEPAYTFGVMGGGGAGFTGYTFGSLFTVVTACTVTDLGAYDHGQDGLNASMPVGIWSAAGTLLASTTVTTSDKLVGFFRYHTLTTPVALTAGQQYYVGAMVTNGSDAVGQSPASFTVDPRITFNSTVYGTGASLVRPTNILGSTPAYITSDFLFGSSNAAPTVTLNTTAIPASSSTLVITGTGFDATAANNTVAFTPTGTGTVTAATPTSLTVSVSGLRAGALNAIVTTNSLDSGAAVQVATVIPVITSTTANLSTTATSLTINGFGFDPTASSNSIAFTPSGTGTVTASTATTLTVTGLSSLTAGALNAIVTSNGQASASAQVATVVTPPPATALTSATDAPPNTTAGTPIAGAAWDSVRSGMTLASSGALAFRGHLAIDGTAVTADNFQGIWKSPDGSNANTVLVARSGSTTVPSVASGLFNVLPINPIINNAAQASFVGFLTVGRGGVTSANDTGVWTELGTGGLKLAAREGSTVGTNTLGTIAPSGWISSGDNALAFTVRLSPAGTAIMRVDVSGATATPSLIAKEGDAAPVVSGGTPGNFDHFGGNSSDPRMDNAGDVAFAAWLDSGTSGIWYSPAGGALSAVANSGQDTPGVADSTILSFERPSLSGDGSTIAFRAFLSTGQAVLKRTLGGLGVIAKSSDTAIAGIPAGSMLWSVWSPFTNAQGSVAFRVSMLDGDGLETRAIMSDTDSTLRVIAKAGDPAPGFGAETFVNFDHPVIGDGNQTAFIASTSAGNVGLFRQALAPAPGGRALALIAKVGDTVTFTRGGSDTIAAITLPGSDSADRKYETKAMDAAGHILVHVTYASGKTGLVLMGQ